ncbi:probable F-box protein [Tanacetum coccineum]
MGSAGGGFSGDGGASDGEVGWSVKIVGGGFYFIFHVLLCNCCELRSVLITDKSRATFPGDMSPGKLDTLSCAEEDVVLRQSYKPESYGKLYYACPKSKFFGAPSTPSYSAGHSTPPSYSSGPSTPPSYSSGPSTPTNYSLRSSRNGECSNCKHLRGKLNAWNSLMLTSINTITLTAATMAGITAAITTVPGAPLEVLKITSSFMYLAATGLLTKIAIGHPNLINVNEAMEKVLAIDRAYPLPLLGTMLEKFPAKTKPAVWWPEKRRTSPAKQQKEKNGWSMELEDGMKEITRVLEVKDKDDYLRLGDKSLKLNKGLAIAGPILTGLGAVGSAFLAFSPWAMALGVMGGAITSVVNTVQHGGQVGMVFEMYRSNAGFFKMMEESIESNLNERDMERRENGEVFEMKVALQLGRSLFELFDVAASSARLGTDIQEFESKLF